MSGSRIFYFEDSSAVEVNPGDIVYLPKYSSYEVSTENSGDCYAINFDLDENIFFTPFSFHIKNQNEIIQLYDRALKAWNLKPIGHIEKCKAELYNILFILLNSYWTEYTPSKKHEIISKGVEYIHHNYLITPIQIDQLASICNITPTYFRKIFRKIYGVSPIKYINILKIEHAKELIEAQMCSISEAAFQSGYSSISHFSREFKKATGISPTEYAKSATNFIESD